MDDELLKALAKYEWNPEFQDRKLESPDQADTDGDTPLHMAAFRGDVDDIRLFLAHGADIDRRGDMGHTPLHYAAMNGHADAVQVLIDLGARLDIVSEFQDIPEETALKSGHLDVSRLIRGARIRQS